MTISQAESGKLWLKVLRRKLIPDGFLWKLRNYSPPSPEHVKRRILLSNSLENAVWVETGTYLGDTTQTLSKISKCVISIEPQPNLSRFSEKRLKRYKNVKVINGTSEASIVGILEGLNGPACFWLDGHYSGDVTYRGSVISPILNELEAISKYVAKDNPVVVFIDDFRLFVGSVSTGYPDHGILVKWAEENNLHWTVEHDIFIAKSV